METNTGKFNSNIIRQWANLIAILAAFFLNVYVNIAPPNGQTIGEISNTIFKNVLITPASYAFAIWGLIYLGLISFGIYQLLPAQRENKVLRRCKYFLVAASLSQIIWIFLFQYQLFTFSVLAMLGILGCLICLYPINMIIALSADDLNKGKRHDKDIRHHCHCLLLHFHIV